MNNDTAPNRISCDTCLDQKSQLSEFTCKHKICTKCLYKILIRNYCQDIIDLKPWVIKCICKKGDIKFSLNQLSSLLDSWTQSNDFFGEDNQSQIQCYSHKKQTAEYFCIDCKEEICIECTIDPCPHANHRTIWTSYYLKVISKQILHLPDWTLLLKRNTLSWINGYNKYTDFINELFDEWIMNIQNYKNTVWESIKLKTDKYKEVVNVVNWWYKQYNKEVGDCINCTTSNTFHNKGMNIHQLLFLLNTKIKLPEINYHYSKASNEINKLISSVLNLNFENNFEVKLNQKFSEFKCVQSVDKAHNADISAMTVWNNLKLITGDYEGNIKVWKMTKKGYSLIQEESPHTKAVISLTSINQNKFASCSGGESEIFLWKEQYTKSNIVKYIISQRINLDVDDDLLSKSKFCSYLTTLSDKNTIISFINDNSIKIYMDKKMNYFYEEVDCFDGHSDGDINCILHMKNEKIVTASDDETWRVWEKDRTYETLIGHKGAVNVVVEIDNDGLLSASKDKNLIIWRKNPEGKYHVQQVLNGHWDSVKAILFLKDQRIVSGGSDDFIKIWFKNRTEYECSMTLRSHKGEISAIVNIDEEAFVSSSYDRTVKVWFVIN